MEEFERLVLEVESRGVAEANKALTTLESTAARAETAVDNLADASNHASSAATRHAAATATASSAVATETAAVVANAGAVVTNAGATAGSSVSLLAQARAWLASRAAAVASGAATAAVTVRTVAASAATAGYAAVSRVATGAIGLLKAAATSLYTQMALLIAPIAALALLVTATRNFQDFQAALKTATGSVQSATVAYAALQKFAATTPYSLDKATESFIKLVNYGLTPSERALKSYGNTSAALNKDIVDMIEAVADAATGEFERLKEFGLLASKQGDQVTFTFRGVQTVVKNTAKDIEAYLIALGENNFGSAMADKMQTLGGAISNLGDAWDTMLSTVSRSSGFDSVVTGAVQRATAALTEITSQLASGQFDASLTAFSMKWSSTFEGIVEAAKWTTGQLKEAVTLWGLLGSTSSDSWTQFWGHFPQSVNAAFSSASADFLTFVDKSQIYGETIAKQFEITFEQFHGYGKAAVDSVIDTFDKLVSSGKATAELLVGQFKVEFDRLVGLASATGSAIAEALGGAIPDISAKFKAVNDAATAQLAGLKSKADAMNKANAEAATIPSATSARFGAVTDAANAKVDASLKAATAQLKAADVVNASVQNQIAAEYTTATTAYDDQLAKAQALRDAYDAKQNAPATGDALAGFSKMSANPSAGAAGKADAGAAGKAATEAQHELDARLKMVQEGLTREHEVLAVDYEERRKKILENVALTESEKTAATLQLMLVSFQTEEQSIADSYDKRKAIILNATEITEEQRGELMVRLAEKREKELASIEQKHQQVRLGAASDFFGNLASIGSTFGKKGFKIAKAAAIAQATIKTYESATSAYASLAGIPYVGPALGAAAAGAAIVAGAANIAQIKAQEYSGAYAHGGMIPSGKYGIAGEAGPEIIRGPAVVTSAANTRNSFGGGNGVRTVTVHNNGQPVEAESRMENGELLIMLKPILDKHKREVKGELTSEITRGGGRTSQALESTYGLRRSAAT